jgi:hypothetical protein
LQDPFLATRPGGQPGYACDADEAGTGDHTAYGTMVVALRTDRIAGITGFPRDIDLFEQLDAPLALPRDKTQACVVDMRGGWSGMLSRRGFCGRRD